MPAARIRFAQSALNDLDAIVGWYRDLGVPDIGQRFVREIFERIDLLATNPDMGRIVPEFEQPYVRELLHPPFRVVYRRDPSLISIVRVWRSERMLQLPPEAEPPPSNTR